MNDHPPWVDLVEFGPDDEGHSYTLVRLLRDDLGLYNLHGLPSDISSPSDRELSDVFNRSNRERVVFAILKTSYPSSLESLLNAFAIESPVPRGRMPLEHHLSSVILPRAWSMEGHGRLIVSLSGQHLELPPRVTGIILWTLVELFGFDPDTDFKPEVRFDLQIPSIVRDGAFDRFRAEPVMQRLNQLIEDWPTGWSSNRAESSFWRTVSTMTAADRLIWTDAEFDKRDIQISKAGYQMLSILNQLHPSLEFTEEGGIIEADLNEGAGFRTIHWSFFVDLVEEMQVVLILEDPATLERGVAKSSRWSLQSLDLGTHLAVHKDFVTALEAAGLLLEESRWEPSYTERVRYAVNPNIVLDIDIEPYLLLDAPTPYVWPDAAFIAFLKQVGKL